MVLRLGHRQLGGWFATTGRGRSAEGMATPAIPSYAGHRFPAEIISRAVWLYFRFPLSLRHADELLAARGIVVSHETVRRSGLKFGRLSPTRPGAGCPRRGTSGTVTRSW